jgi:hypothetical protein
MKKPIVPTVHLNGTSKERLLEDLRKAHDAIEQARYAIPVPHGRDYYPQGEDALGKALDQCLKQIKSLEAMADQFAYIIAKVDGQ